MKHLASLILFAAAASVSPAAIVLSSDHADIGINYIVPEPGWDLHVHDGATDTEYAPEEVIFEVGAAGFGTLPDNAAFGALAGTTVFTLPAVNNPALLHLGFGAEELAGGIFVDDVVTLTLLSVSGPGSFVVWRDDSFGGFEVPMIGGSGLIELNAGAHEHYNLSFTSAGSYAVTLQGSGLLVPALGGFMTSSSAIYSFQVIPEPGTWALLAGAVALVVAFRRRR